MAGKWVEFLKEVAPKVTKVAAMFNPIHLRGAANTFWARCRLPLGLSG